MSSLLVEILAAGVFITAPAAPAPVEYTAQSGNTVLGYRRFDGWVPYHLCFNLCKTTPGEPVLLLGGGLSLADMAALEIQIRADGKKVVEFGSLFGAGPVIWKYPPD